MLTYLAAKKKNKVELVQHSKHLEANGFVAAFSYGNTSLSSSRGREASEVRSQCSLFYQSCSMKSMHCRQEVQC